MSENQAVEVSVKVPDNQLNAQDSIAANWLQDAKALEVDLTVDENTLAERAKVAANIAKTCKTAVKQREELRLKWTKPIRESISNINDSFKPGTEMLDQAARIAGNVAIEYQNEQQRRIAEYNARIKAENEAAAKQATAAAEMQARHSDSEEPPVQPIVAAQKSMKFTPPKAIKTRSEWTFEIEKTYKKHGDTVLEYLRDTGKFDEVLEKAIREKIRQAKKAGNIETLKISGVRIYQSEIAVNR